MASFPRCDKTDCFANIDRFGDGKFVCDCLTVADKDCKFYKADVDGQIRRRIVRDMKVYGSTMKGENL